MDQSINKLGVCIKFRKHHCAQKALVTGIKSEKFSYTSHRSTELSIPYICLCLKSFVIAKDISNKILYFNQQIQ
jgi:hypothetical protein